MNHRLDWVSLPARRLADDPSLQRDWDRLNDLRGGVPVLASLMVSTAVEVFASHAERLMVARRDADVVAMLVLQPAGPMRWQTFQPSQLPLGPWVATPDLAPEALAEAIVRSGVLGLTLMVGITQIDPRIATRPDDTPCRLTLDYVRTGWIDIQGSFDEYWATRGKNLRQNLRKQRNRLAADGLATQMRIVDSSDEMAAAVKRYGALEGKGWKAAKGTAILADNPQGRFYAQLLSRAAELGQAQVYEYWFDDRLVASDLVVLRGRAMVVLKTTYDEAERSTSPSFLLREEELRLLFADRSITRLEFYGRMMEWHTRWTESSVLLHHVSVFRWAWLKQLAVRVGERRRRQAALAAESDTAAAPQT